MTLSLEERTAVNEVSIKDIRQDIQEIKNAVKELERIAQSGSGAFRTILYIGSALGWIVGLSVTIMNAFRGH